MKNISPEDNFKIKICEVYQMEDLEIRDNSVYFIWNDKNGTHKVNVSEGNVIWTDNEGKYTARI